MSHEQGKNNTFRQNLLTTTSRIATQSLSSLAIAGMILGTTPNLALALDNLATPTGGNVVGGAATISSPTAGQLNINQTTNRAVIDWNSFNIGKDAKTEFFQPSSNSMAINRVTGAGNDPTQILGSLKSNGRIMILDTNGIFFGAGSTIDVGGIVASTGTIDANAFMSGSSSKITFSNIAGSGSIINEGQITAAEGGLVAFVAPHIRNSGVITARLGRVDMVAGDQVTIDFYGDKLVEIQIDAALEDALIEHSGQINADGGLVTMTASLARNVVDTVINMDGIVRAQSVGMQNGKIVLGGGSNGTVHVSGTLDARGLDGDVTGGGIIVTGREISIDNGAVLDVSGNKGAGDVFVGGGFRGETPDLAEAENVTVHQGASIHADGLDDGDGGLIVLWATDTASLYGSLTAKGGANGGDGGLMELSGQQNVGFSGIVNASAAFG